MTDDTQKDAPLLRCWLKKSWSTSKKVGLWLGGIAVVLISAYVAWLGLTSQIAAKIWAAVTGWYSSIIAGISNYIAAIPPLVFWGSVIVGVIAVGVLGYSLVWCMVRNLQDCDWKSGTAIIVALALTALTALAAIAALLALTALTALLALTALTVLTALTALTALIALTTLALIALPVLATSAGNPASSWYYVFRFVGAYLNYRKRTKATPTTSVVEEAEE